MASKYRLRLTNGRVVGPFTQNQVRELFEKGHIHGQEEVQLFPIGEWAPFGSYKELVAVLTAEQAGNDEGLTSHTVARLNVVKKTQEAKKKAAAKAEDEALVVQKETPAEGSAVTKNEFVEFVFKKDDTAGFDYHALEKEYQEKKESEGPPPLQQGEVEKTVLIQRANLAASQSVDKTVIVNPQALQEIKEDIEEIEETQESYEKTKKEILATELPVDTEDATQMVVLSDVMREIKAEAKETEVGLEQKLEEESVITGTQSFDLEEDEEEEEDSKGRRATRPIVLLSILLLIVYLLMDEEKKKPELNPLNVMIEFPVSYEKSDPLLSQQKMAEAMGSYSHTYPARLKTIVALKESLALDFNASEALPWLLRVYAEVMENAQDQLRARQVIFKFTQIARSKVLTDPNAALGTAIFYQKTGKSQTARATIENYLRLGRPTLEILGDYLQILIDVGDLVQAKKAYERLEGQPKKPLRAYLAMAKYLGIEEKHAEAKLLLEEAGSHYGDSVELLLIYADSLLLAGDLNNYQAALEKVEGLEAEKSPVYTAMYFERMGMLSAYKEKLDLAAKLFNMALALKESDELRSKLATLQLGGGNANERLILESRVLQLMKKAEHAVGTKNWELAFTHAINAVDTLDHYIPAQILLADIQVQRGYFEDALRTLYNLKKNYPINSNVSFKLLSALISARKFVPAQEQILLIGQTSLKDMPEYSSYLAQYYEEMGNINLAIKNYSIAVQRDPLRDEDYFRLGEIYLNYKKYNNAKNMISRAIELDPLNVDYLATYAKILYELDSADAAIGYLRNALENFPDSPRLLGDIAMYYYRNGEIKQFETYKARVEALPLKDRGFYRFLVESAKLEGKIEKVIEYSKELLQVAPGNMEARMLLGSYLLNNQRYDEAYRTFIETRERLASFPKVNYFLAKVMIKQKNYKQALEFAKKEVELNPTLEFGHFIVGEVNRLMGNISEAESALEKAISLNGHYVEALMSLGWIKRGQRLFEPARELYLRALKLELNNPEIHKELCFIYRDIGQSGLAVESCQTYLQLLPGAPDTGQIEGLIQKLR